MASSFKKKSTTKPTYPRGTKPSFHNSSLLVSTGVPSLDSLLGSSAIDMTCSVCGNLQLAAAGPFCYVTVFYISLIHFRWRNSSWHGYFHRYVNFLF